MAFFMVRFPMGSTLGVDKKKPEFKEVGQTVKSGYYRETQFILVLPFGWAEKESPTLARICGVTAALK
ncbi:MAG: hypothetical protein HY343_11705 [Lentisphaerae bacterium]|nr:hypothetical protein [Lentisphaerota bacterium]